MFKLNRAIPCRVVWVRKLMVSHSQQQQQAVNQQRSVDYNPEEYTDVAQYPKIYDLSFRARKQREATNWQNSIQNVPTVEEKMIKINMPRYYGYKVIHLNGRRLPYNCLPAIQHYTRTVFENMSSTDKEDALVKQVEAIQSDIKDAVQLAHDVFRLKHVGQKKLEPWESEEILSQIIVEQINRALINGLAADYQHLQEMEVDYNPRHEAFWAVGGIQPPKNVVKSKEGRDWQKEMVKDNVDRMMQYKSVPMLALRHRFQLEPWKNQEDIENRTMVEKVPRYELDPRTLGYSTIYQHGTNIAGYWPSTMADFGYLSYQLRSFMHMRPPNCDAEDSLEALHAAAIQSSFAWLLAQAHYNGFNTYSELTYPLNTQTVITNGRLWSFYEYQLNTLLMHGSQIDENPRVNYCRGTDVLSLYESIDDKGNIEGFSDQVLYHLVKFYTKLPSVQRPVHELQPYLGVDVKHIADYTNDDKREFLENIFKHIVSNRPRHLAKPEIYLWEKIYKIDHKTRPLEARRRFFELDINPWRRTFDQHQKEYIPKVLRPEGPKSKKKWKNTYYP